VDLAHLPPNDPSVYRMLCEADTIGVFQVESRAQMATLPRLGPASFYDIVVQVAIIRPGPIVGQMVHPYLNRRAGREAVVYAHPSLEPILARTLGVPLFQEQLLRMAMVAAGFTGGQAEELRRAFGFKRSERRMKQVEVQLREGMARTGITGDAAEQIIASITSFALYGFPESHAASFALLAYASAYLKAHYPAAFYTRCSTTSRWGSTTRRRSSRTHSGAASGFIRSTSRCPTGTAPSKPTARSGSDCATQAVLREQVGKAICRPTLLGSAHGGPKRPALQSVCPKCGCDDPSMIEEADGRAFCNVCSHEWRASTITPRRFATLDDLVTRTGLRRDEVVTLADIGALNSFGYDRRSAYGSRKSSAACRGTVSQRRTQRKQRTPRCRAQRQSHHRQSSAH
jgi:error-prone DNA polymerase